MSAVSGESPTSARAAMPRYRTGTVARLLRMPVATLRIWERRYGVVAPPLSPAGHRLYSDADLARLRLLKHLVDEGHAIGTLAGLGDEQLQQTARSSPAAGPAGDPEPEPGPRGLALVGSGLLQRLPVRVAAAAPLVASAADLAEAAAWPAERRAALLLVHLPAVQATAAQQVLWLAGRLGARRTVLIYGYAAAPTLQALRARGVLLRREPVAEADLADLLPTAAAPMTRPAPGASATPPVSAPGEAPLRRYDDATLSDIARRTPAITCECPRHIAELLMQLSAFETYSRECAHRSPADAALHADLGRVAGTARALFERALERLAQAEGIALPG